MFGQSKNDQHDDNQAKNQVNGQSIDGVVAPNDATKPVNDFNPALPTPGTDFGASASSPAAPAPDEHDSAPHDVTSVLPANGTNDLLDIKQQALSQLSPLVGHLDQTPEEKFRTTMMMIQASDNQALVKDAYEAAQAITDEKAKAQALLDIVNEINYFTQHHQG